MIVARAKRVPVNDLLVIFFATESIADSSQGTCGSGQPRKCAARTYNRDGANRALFGMGAGLYYSDKQFDESQL